jgi:hypothetical protein
MTGKTMTLPACQQRLLDTIETALQKREPRLASMFAMFTRLNNDEGIPRTERLSTPPWWAFRQRPSHAGRTATIVQAALLMPLVVMAVVAAVFLGMAASQRVPCTLASGPHGLVTGQRHATSCRSDSGFGASGHGP